MSSKYIIFVVPIAIVILCFFPWAVIPSAQTVISGFSAPHTNLGKPGILTLVFALSTALFQLTLKNKMKIGTVISAALLLAWQIRNWLLLSICEFGECMDISFFFYLSLALSIFYFGYIVFASYRKQ